MPHLLRCPEGHQWNQPEEGGAAERQGGCPVCGAERLADATEVMAAAETVPLPAAPNHAAPHHGWGETLPPRPLSRDSGPVDPLARTLAERPHSHEPPGAPDLGVTLPTGGPGVSGHDPDAMTLPPSAIPTNRPVEPPATNDTQMRAPASATQGPNVPTVSVAVRPVAGGPTIPGYKLLGELGRGGMGVVYKAQDTRLHRVVALKMILSGEYAEEADLARFRLEAEAVAKLQHPNIVQVFAIDECDGRPYFSLEFVDGGPLDKKLSGNPLPPQQGAELLEQLARAMHYAHHHDILHRDLKPANVLLTTDGTPKITDFGLAKKLDDRENSKTQGGAIMGTPSYMAPEQALGKDDIGPAADIHSLGAILYEFLTGRPPFKGATVLDTLEQVRSQEPVAPSRLMPKVPRDLETICLKCLHKDPVKRYATAGDLADDVKRFLEGEPIRARPVGRVERTVKWLKKRPLAGALIGVCVLAVAGVLALWGRFTLQLEDKHIQLLAEQQEKQNALELSEAARYAGTISLAYRELLATTTNQLRRAEEFLDRSDPKHRGWEYHYLATLLSSRKQALATQPGQIRGIAFSPNGQFLATASGNRTIKLWDVHTGKPRQWKDPQTGQAWHALEGHTDGVSAIAFSPDGSLLASGSNDRTIRLWDTRTGKVARILKGHTDRLWGVNFSPDGSRLASASEDRRVKVWDVQTGELITTLTGHAEPTRVACFSPDGKELATCSEDRTVKLWDTATWKEKPGPDTHRSKVAGIAYSPDGKWFVSIEQGQASATVRVWEVGKQTGLGQSFEAPGARSIAFSKDDRLATCGSKGISLWDVAERKLLQPVAGMQGPLSGVCFSPDGLRLAAAAGGMFGGGAVRGATPDGSAIIWDLEANEGLTLKDPVLRRGCIGMSPDGKWLASAVSPSPRVTLWDDKGKETWNIETHVARIRALCFSRDGKFLATASEDNTFKVWDIAARKEVFTGDHTDAVLAVNFSPDGTRFVSAGEDGTVKVWKTTGAWRVEKTFQGQKAAVCAVCFSEDGKRLAYGGEDRVVRVLNVDGSEEKLLRGHTGEVRGLAFNPDGSRLASASADNTAIVWDLSTGKDLHVLREHTRTVWTVRFLPDGKHLATTGADQLLLLWEVATGKEVFRHKIDATDDWDVALALREKKGGEELLALGLEGPIWKVWDARKGRELQTLRLKSSDVKGICFNRDGLVASTAEGLVRLADGRRDLLVRWLGDPKDKARFLGLSFSPDGTQLVTGGDDKKVKVWTVKTGAVQTLGEHADLVFSVAFSHDGKRVASASRDRTVKVWNVATGRVEQTLTGHTDWVRCVRFSMDGSRLATAGEDGLVQVWNAQTWTLERTIKGHKGPVFSVCFSPDGKLLASTSEDQTIKLWDAATGQELRTLTSTLPVLSSCFNRDGTRLATGNQEGIVQIWDTRTGLETLLIKEQNSEVWSVAFSEDDALAYSSQTVRVYRTKIQR